MFNHNFLHVLFHQPLCIASYPCQNGCPSLVPLDFTMHFYGMGLLAPRQTPNLENQGASFCLNHHLGLSGMEVPTSSMCHHQQSSRDHMTTQAPPLRQSRDTFRRNMHIYTIIICFHQPSTWVCFGTSRPLELYSVHQSMQ
jgi:hypothetical protein